MLVSIALTTVTVCTARCVPAQNVSTRRNGPRPETRPTWPRPRHIAPRPRRDLRCIGSRSRRDRDVEDFVRDRDETLVRLETISRPSRDRDVSTETTSLMCNDKTSSNMYRNFCLKHFCISRDTNKIALHAITQSFQEVHHFRCCSYSGYAKTSQWAELSVN